MNEHNQMVMLLLTCLMIRVTVKVAQSVIVDEYDNDNGFIT